MPHAHHRRDLQTPVHPVQPGHLPPRFGYRGDVLFKYEPADAEHVVLDVLLPVDFGHVEVEFLLVLLAQGQAEGAHVLVAEAPLVRREVLQTGGGFAQLVLDPDHSANCRRIRRCN